MPHTQHHTTFSSLQLIEPILKAVSEEGYTTPTPIQEQAIPIVLKGRDLMGCAQTGTGKTAAFAIPILQLLHAEKGPERHKHISSLIVTPTRELAIQIKESFDAYGRHAGLRTAVIFGGVGQKPQTDTLKRGVDILVATPGRLLDLMGQGFISLQHIRIFVLDEADRMLDMGFIHDVKKIIKALPVKRQSLFFSATMPPEIVTLAGTILHQPESVTVTPVSSTVEVIDQHVLFVDKGNKGNLLLHLLKDPAITTALVFTRTKHGADKVVRLLQKNGEKAEAIHGNKAQNARQRALSNFKSRATRVLVATDIAARGIDVDNMEFVINFDIPNIPETYVHRIGRTGRAGANGTAYSFCDAEEKAYLKDIEKLIGKQVPRIDDHPYPMTGQRSAAAAPAEPRQQQQRSSAPRQNTPRQRTSQPRQGNAEHGRQQQQNRSSSSPQHSGTPKSSSHRPERPHSSGGQRTERNERGDRNDRSSRPERTERSDRNDRSGRPERSPRPTSHREEGTSQRPGSGRNRTRRGGNSTSRSSGSTTRTTSAPVEKKKKSWLEYLGFKRSK